MKKFVFILVASFLPLFVIAQGEAAKVTIRADRTEDIKVGDKIHLLVEMEPKNNWYVYSALPTDGEAYMPTTITYEITSAGFESDAKIEEKGYMIEEYDDIMAGMMRYYKVPVTFSQELKITEPEITIAGYVDYMACNGEKCTMYTQEFSIQLKTAE